MDTQTTTVTHTWLRSEDAAVRLGVSARTIARKVARHELESRLDADGRREVLVAVEGPLRNDGQPSDASSGPDPSDACLQSDVRTLAVADPVVRHLAQVLAAEVPHLRRSRRLAWTVSGSVLVLAAVASVVLSVKLSSVTTMTQAQAHELDRIRTDADRLHHELDAARADAQDARSRADRMEGRVDILERPATQPARPVTLWSLIGPGEKQVP